MLEAPEPLQVGAALVRGYHRQRSLSEAELAALPTLIRLRLALSVANSARQSKREPERDYLRVSEAGAWRLLERLEGAPARIAELVSGKRAG